MNIFSFTAHFGSEEDCRLHFKEQRDKEGVVCKRCGALPIIGYRVNGVMNAKVAVSHLVAQRYDHGELQAAVSGVVQNDVPDELQKRDSPPTNSRSN